MTWIERAAERNIVSDSLEKQIKKMAARRNAVILAHNYQVGEVQDIADFVGDSLGLSVQASKTDAEVILFCGVHFMAETAKIISPDKTVLLPDPNAGCPMANMVTARQLRELKAKYPDALVAGYVNTTAQIKAECDVCVTSGNAVRVIASLPADRPIVFVPDKSLGDYVSRQTGREMILWNGFCPTHHRILARHVQEAVQEHPDAKVVVHPECQRDVIELADVVASTSGILNYCRESDVREFIIGTEVGILHRLAKENPGKSFYAASPVANCPNMKLITPEKMLWALEDLAPEVTVPDDVAAAARRSIERMLETT